MHSYQINKNCISYNISSKIFNICFRINCSDIKFKTTGEHSDLSILHLLILSDNNIYSPLDLLIDYVGCK